MQVQRRVGIAITAIVVLVLLGLFVFRTAAFSSWDFRSNLWGPSLLLTQGQSPYRVDQIFELGAAVWMPMAVGVFFPLGFLSLQQATNLWFIFNMIWLLGIVWLSFDARRPSVTQLALAVLLSLLFPPTVTHVWAGQISILITFAWLFLCIREDEMPAFWLAALMTIGLSKPQLAVLVLPGFFIHRLNRYGVWKTIQLGLYLLLGILLSTIPLFAAYPGWIPDFIDSIQQNPSWAQPSSLYILRSTFPHYGTAIWMTLALIVLLINLWIWTRFSKHDAANWSLALTTLVSPYVWTWDFVLLLPLLLSALAKSKAKLSTGILLADYVLCWVLIVNMKFRGDVQDSLFWWVPWLFIALIVAGNKLEQLSNSSGTQNPEVHP